MLHNTFLLTTWAPVSQNKVQGAASVSENKPLSLFCLKHANLKATHSTDFSKSLWVGEIGQRLWRENCSPCYNLLLHCIADMDAARLYSCRVGTVP